MGLPPGASKEVTLIRPLRGHLFPWRGKAGRAADSRPYGGYRSRSFFCRGRSQTGPQLRTSYHLFGQTRRSRGTAPAEIFANPGPSGPEGIQTRHSDFARRKFSIDTQVRVPRNGVRGKVTMSTKCSSGAVPGDPLVSFPSLGKKLAAGAAKFSPHTTNPIQNLPPHPPQCAHWGTFPPGGRRMGGHMGPPIRRIQHRERLLGKSRRGNETAAAAIFADPGPSGPAGV